MSSQAAPKHVSIWRTEISLVLLIGCLLVFFIFPGTWSSQPALAPGQSIVVFLVLLGVIGWGAFAVLRHAEVLAMLLGQPLGTLILTLSVILIEVAMIVALLLTGPADSAVARDTMFAVLMIVLNGLVGVCLLVGGIRHKQPIINLQGSGAFLAVLIVLGMMSLVIPTATSSKPGGEASLPFSIYLIATCVVAYGVFLFVQTGRYRGWFKDVGDEEHHELGFQIRSVPVHATLLVAHLVPIVLLAKQMATFVDAGIHSAGMPAALGGMVIALIVLSPEAMVAVRAARHNSMQQSVNICLGSGLATIGLTVPAVLIVAFITGVTIELGLEPWDLALLIITFLLSMQTFGSDRTNYLQGVLHLVLFGAYMVLIFE